MKVLHPLDSAYPNQRDRARRMKKSEASVINTLHWVTVRRIVQSACALIVTSNAFAQPAPAGANFLNINPSWSQDGRQLVFESGRHGNSEIYIINADGTGERRLTWTGAETQNTHPSWSPDGSAIVFDSDRDGVYNLYVIRPDGTGLKRLTYPGTSAAADFARHPEWSPDGRFIAFDSSRDGNGEIYVVRPDGTGLLRLTNTPLNESHTAWTPDSKVIIAQGPREQRTLWTADPVTGEMQPLRAPSRFYGSINISPDGKYFIYRSSTDSTPRLYVSPIDTATPPRALTMPGNTSYESAWARDGSRLAFYSDRTGKFEIYVADADGQNVRQVTNGSYESASPSWSADGGRIVFASNRTGDWQVHSMSATGTNVGQLTFTPGDDANPAFLPDGRVVFESGRNHAATGLTDLYVVDGSGGAVRRLTFSRALRAAAAPSRNGTAMAFQRRSSSDEAWNLFVLDTLGAAERQLTNNTYDSETPVWMRGDTALVFHANPEGRNQLFVLALRSGSVRPLLQSRANDAMPAISPDGRLIAFQSDRDGWNDVYALDVHTSAVSRMTRNLNVHGRMSWAPDSNALIFAASADGVRDVFVVKHDGTEPVTLTRGATGLLP